MDTPIETLSALKEGNQRFVSKQTIEENRVHKRIENQRPSTIIVSCSDSRVPPEIVLDQGVGDLFSIRVAGNIISPVELAGIEFAAQEFGSHLVLVMGHTCCGAVKATVNVVQSDDKPNLSDGLQTIVDFIEPSVDTTSTVNFDQQVAQTIKANVLNAVNHIKRESTLIQQLIADKGMMVVGAQYAIETGEVEFFDD